MLNKTSLLAALGLPEHPDGIEDYIETWSKVGTAAKILTTLEMEMRKTLVGYHFGGFNEGTHKTVAGGYTLKATLKMSRTIDESQLAIARAEYDLLNDKPVLFDELIKTKYELSVSAYRKLGVDDLDHINRAKKAIDRMIVAKPASPTLEVS